MKQESIICPQCKNDIPLTEAITHKIQAELKAKFESDFAVKEKEPCGVSTKKSIASSRLQAR